MNFLFQTILPYILVYKYWALGVVTFLACLALPIPAGTLLVASAAFASQGYFNIYVVLIVVLIANMAGDSACYWVARLYGTRLLYKVGFKKVIDSKNFRLIEKVIKERPGFIIFISRFEVIATLTVNAIAGISQVPYKKFLAFEAMGAVVDTVGYAMIGYLFASTWQVINDLIGNFSIIIFIILAIIIILFWRRLMKSVSVDEIATKA